MEAVNIHLLLTRIVYTGKEKSKECTLDEVCTSHPVSQTWGHCMFQDAFLPVFLSQNATKCSDRLWGLYECPGSNQKVPKLMWVTLAYSLTIGKPRRLG